MIRFPHLLSLLAVLFHVGTLPARRPEPDKTAASGRVGLAKPSLEVCLNASDAEAAKKFFVEGLGLTARPEPKAVPGANLKMQLFSVGNSTIKVRTYKDTPKKLPADIAARNGFRLLTVPVEKFDDVLARLKKLGAEVGDVQKTGDNRWALARDADGTAFELVEVSTGATLELEIGLVVADLDQARTFFTEVYGAKELPESKGRVLAGEKELRFTTGATVFKCWAPKGERPSDTAKIQDALGFRYVTNNVRDAQKVHDSFVVKKIDIATPVSNFQNVATLFMARGPGGVLLEFISYGGGKQPMPPAKKDPSAIAPQPPAKAPEVKLPKDGPFLDFTFTTDYFAGAQKAGSPLAQVTEANALVPHSGWLYCCVSYMPESKKLADVNPKVLVKKSADGPWEVDLEAGSEFMRLSFMHSVSFTTDGTGKKLPKPVPVLVCGTGAWRSQPTGVTVFSRGTMPPRRTQATYLS